MRVLTGQGEGRGDKDRERNLEASEGLDEVKLFIHLPGKALHYIFLGYERNAGKTRSRSKAKQECKVDRAKTRDKRQDNEDTKTTTWIRAIIPSFEVALGAIL